MFQSTCSIISKGQVRGGGLWCQLNVVFCLFLALRMHAMVPVADVLLQLFELQPGYTFAVLQVCCLSCDFSSLPCDL